MAVANDDDAMGVDAVLLRVRGIEKETDLGVGILGCMLKGEVALHAPRASVVHGEHVPAMGAEELGDVEILLVAGKAVEDDRGGMRTFSGSEIEDAKQVAAVAGQHHLAGRGGDSGRTGR